MRELNRGIAFRNCSMRVYMGNQSGIQFPTTAAFSTNYASAAAAGWPKSSTGRPPLRCTPGAHGRSNPPQWCHADKAHFRTTEFQHKCLQGMTEFSSDCNFDGNAEAERHSRAAAAAIDCPAANACTTGYVASLATMLIAFIVIHTECHVYVQLQLWALM